MQCLQRTIKCMNKNIYANDRGRVNNLPWEHNQATTFLRIAEPSLFIPSKHKRRKKKKRNRNCKKYIAFCFHSHDTTDPTDNKTNVTSATAQRHSHKNDLSLAATKSNSFLFQLFISFTIRCSRLVLPCIAALIRNHVCNNVAFRL